MTDVSTFSGSAEEWDRAVMTMPGWTHFHRFGWKTVLEETMRHQCVHLVVHDEGGAPAGVLPLVHVRSLLFGRYLVSMPFVNYGGPLGDPSAVSALTERAAELAGQAGAKSLELRSRTELPVSFPASHRKVTVLLDLPPNDPDALMKGFAAKVRSQIRRPAKEGVEVRMGPDQVDPFYRVFATHMRDLGTPVLPRAFFRAIARTFPEDAWFACAYLDGRPIAAGAGFRWADEVEMTWASALRSHKRIAANMLLYWEVMRWATETGATTFNFGRCTPGGGTHRFKRQWGGRDQTLWWYHRPSDQAATPSPDDARYAWGPRVWSRLPVSVANVLGPHVVRGIP